MRATKKTWVFLFITIFSSVLGNYFLAAGMRQVGELVTPNPFAYIQALFHPQVALGVALLIVWILSHMLLLSWADLSFVLPTTSVGYILSAFTGMWLLGEKISASRWGGIILIMAGVVMVGRTPQDTVRGRG